MAESLIVVPDDFPSVFKGTAAEERCAHLGETRVYVERGANEEAELIRRLDRARVAINIRAHACFTDTVFAACPALKLISIWGTGTDNIDLESAQRRGITVCNTAGVNANAVAEHTIALMLAVARRIPKLDREMRTGAWPREMLTQLLGKRLGVFGTGTIGMRVIAWPRPGNGGLAWSARGTPRVSAAGARAATKEEILSQADVVTLHLRLSPETRGFLAQHELSLMKQPAILINTSAGRWSIGPRSSSRWPGQDLRQARCLPRRAAQGQRSDLGFAQRRTRRTVGQRPRSSGRPPARG
jgi:phosphoglycerate dehydrogenase-like enzyme